MIGIEFDEHVPGFELRVEQLAATLEKTPGEIHPKLRDPEKRLSMYDKQAARLTYGQMVNRIDTDYSPGLPSGAVKRTDLVENLHLMEFHIIAINRYLSNHSVRQVPDRLAGLEVVNLQDEQDDEGKKDINNVRPIVEGHRWLSGNRVKLDNERSILIFSPWITPWVRGGSPFPALYTVGNVTPEELDEVTFAYGTEYK